MSGPREPIRILELISGLGVGGAETALRNVAIGLRNRGWIVDVMSLTAPGPTGDTIESAGIRVESLGMTRGRPSPVAFAKLLRRLVKRPPDILQSWLYHADLLGTIAAACVPVRRLAWNVRASDMDLTVYRRMSRWTLRACVALSGRPDVVVANSYSGVDHHIALGYRPKRWSVIPNGFDCEKLRPDPEAGERIRRETDLGADDFVVALMARFDPMKDHETFIRAAGLLSREHPDARFLLAGEDVTPSNETLAAWIREEGLGERVHLLGPREDVPAVCAAADVATLSSSWGEGFPNVLGEAMSCGVPCVATDVGDVRRILGETGIVVPPRRPEILAEGWRQMRSFGRTGRKALGEQARERIRRQYGLGVCLDRYEELYLDILGAS